MISLLPYFSIEPVEISITLHLIVYTYCEPQTEDGESEQRHDRVGRYHKAY